MHNWILLIESLNCHHTILLATIINTVNRIIIYEDCDITIVACFQDICDSICIKTSKMEIYSHKTSFTHLINCSVI